MTLPIVDWQALKFGQQDYLWLLMAPAALLVVWLWQVARRRADVRRYLRHRAVPVRETFSAFGGLVFWLCLLGATTSVILALARPQVVTTRVRRAGIDLVVLQDGSTSMRVTDTTGDRWKRSMRFLRVLAETMRWDGDRIAMTSFARIATPQVRLTKDPNTFFFFIDHLLEPPFRAEDDASWDTNIEMGISWGLKLIAQDERVTKRRSLNAKAFLLLSDGQAWSGEVQRALQTARRERVPVFVVGVGTSSGGFIPEPPVEDPQKEPLPRVYSRLDRESLATIASAGGGRYMELDRERDIDIAVTVVDSVRKMGRGGVEEGADDVYWACLAAGAVFLVLGIAFVRDRAELALATAGAAAALAVVQLL